MIDTLGIGGAERYVTRIAPLLRVRGFELEVCALDASGPLRAELAAAGIKVHSTRYPERTRGSNTLALVRTVRDIAGLARGFDAVHTYLFWSDVLGGLAGGLARRRRVIVTRRALHSWRHPRSRFMHALEAVSNLAATEVLANSQTVLEDAARNEPTLPRRRGVVYPGVDVARYRPAAGHRRGLRMVVVGALSPRKGQSTAIEALARVRQAGKQASLDLVGEGPDREALQRQVERLGLATAVNFSGAQADPRPHLEGADLFLLPSRQEGFSNALLEAMASGLPAVVTDTGGNSEAIEDGCGGSVVASEDPEAMASALLEWTSSERRTEAGRRNRQRAAERFSLDASAEALASWYRSDG
ncbi:MAG TPA: glycosyltransferase [Candidatus Dormibacteraeota bacterium]